MSDLPTLRSLKLGGFSKKLKKPGDSVKNLEILTGHFFHSDKFKEQFQ